MNTQWRDPAPNLPRRGIADRWAVIQGERVIGTFDRIKEARAFAKDKSGVRIERQRNVLVLGHDGLREGKIGF